MLAGDEENGDGFGEGVGVLEVGYGDGGDVVEIVLSIGVAVSSYPRGGGVDSGSGRFSNSISRRYE